MMFKAATALVVVAFGLAAGGCATGSSSSSQPAAQVASAAVNRAVAAGEVALREHRYDDALQQFQRVLHQEPGHVGGKLGVAETYLALGAYREAAALFDELRSIPEIRAEAAQGAGLARLQAGETEEARALLQEAVDADSRLWRTWNGLARSYDLEREWQKAADAYAKALATAAEPAVIHNNWGMSLLAQGRHAEAAVHFSQALQNGPASATAKTNLRLALAYQARYAEALSGVDRQELPQALNNVGYIALMRGDLEHAEAYFLRALERSPSFYEIAAKNLQLLGNMRQVQAVAPAES